MPKIGVKNFFRWCLGILLLTALLVRGDLSRFAQLGETNIPLLLAALSCSGCGFYLTARRWASILKALSPFREYPPGFFWRTVVFGHSSNFLGLSGVGMDATKLFMIKSMTPVPTKIALCAITLERILDLLLLFFVGLPAIARFFHLISSVTAFQLILGSILLFCLATLLLPLSRLVMLFVHQYQKSVEVLHHLPCFAKRNSPHQEFTLPEAFSYTTVMLIVGCTVGRFLFLCGNAFFLAWAFHLSMPLTIFLVATPLLQLSSFINITPGGIGIMDASRYAVFMTFGMNAGDAMLYVIGAQIANTITVVIAAGTAYLPTRVFHAMERVKGA